MWAASLDVAYIDLAPDNDNVLNELLTNWYKVSFQQLSNVHGPPFNRNRVAWKYPTIRLRSRYHVQGNRFRLSWSASGLEISFWKGNEGMFKFMWLKFMFFMFINRLIKMLLIFITFLFIFLPRSVTSTWSHCCHKFPWIWVSSRKRPPAPACGCKTPRRRWRQRAGMAAKRTRINCCPTPAPSPRRYSFTWLTLSATALTTWSWRGCSADPVLQRHHLRPAHPQHHPPVRLPPDRHPQHRLLRGG